MQLPDFRQRQLDVLALERDPALGKGPQLVSVVFKHLALHRVVLVVVGVNEYGRNSLLQAVLIGKQVVELILPPLLRDWRDRGKPQLSILGVIVPVSGLEYGVFPEIVAKHFLHQSDHASERVGHPVVLLLERDDECVDKLDLVFQDVHEALDGTLLLDCGCLKINFYLNFSSNV